MFKERKKKKEKHLDICFVLVFGRFLVGFWWAVPSET